MIDFEANIILNVSRNMTKKKNISLPSKMLIHYNKILAYHVFDTVDCLVQRREMTQNLHEV